MRARGVHGPGGLFEFAPHGLVFHQKFCLRRESARSRMVRLALSFYPCLRGGRSSLGRAAGSHSVIPHPRGLPGDYHLGGQFYRQKRHREHSGDRRGPGFHGDEPGRGRDEKRSGHSLDDGLDLAFRFFDLLADQAVRLLHLWERNHRHPR